VYRLYILEAELFPTYLEVSFNYPARLADENTTWSDMSCSELWEDETASSFGTDASCALSTDQMSLKVLLGKVARVQVGHKVSMKYGILLVDDRIVVEPTELSAVAMTRAPIVALQGVLLAPDAVQACSNVRLSLAASTGFARRAPVIEWKLSHHTDLLLNAMLQPTLDAANEMMLQVLEIPAQIFSDAFVAVQDLQEVQSDLKLEIEGSISNWQGQSDETSAVLTVLDVPTPLLQLTPASMKEMNISNFEEVEMVVDFFPSSRCSNYSTADALSQLIVQWEYLLRNDTICVEEIPRPSMDAVNASDNMSNMSNDSNDTNESNVSGESNDSNFLNWSNQSNLSYPDTIMISRPCVELIWQPLENTSFRDLNPRPGSLRLPAFSFQPNSSHQFRAAATFQGYTGRNPSVTFTVNIQERTRPVAIITGPSEVSTACSFNLSAGESYDAAVPKEDPNHRHLEFSWYCFEGIVTHLNETELLDAQECNLSNIVGWSERPELQMEGDVLEEGYYSFMLQVRRIDNGTEGKTPPPGEAWWVVRLSPRSLPIVLLKMPWQDGQQVSTTGNLGPAVAEVYGTSSCPIPNWTWNWVLTQAGVILAVLQTSVQSLGTSFTVSTTEFRRDLILPRQSYTYSLVASYDDWVKQVPGSSLLSDLIAAGAFVLESHPFLSNAPPADGLVELVPLSGEELNTPFAVSTFGWTDEQESLISYSFVRFPLDLSDSSRVSADGSGGITLHNGFMWSVPKIDWRNSSSQMYFRKQGGLTLQTWDSRSRLTDVFMAVGSYFIVVRARDIQGGEGEAAVLGPVVVEAANSTDGTTVLEASYTARDAERILNTVDALLSSPDVAWDGSPTPSLLTALEVATSILDPNPEALEKMSQILVTTVGTGNEGNGGIDTSQLFRASEILETCLTLAVESPEAGIGNVVAVAMLEALSTFNEVGRVTNLNGPNGPFEQSANYTQKMEQLASKLAAAAHAKLPVGESKFLSGASGGQRAAQGVELQLLSSTNSALLMSGVTMPRLVMPPNPLKPIDQMSRRLQSESCGGVSITATYWLRSNPYTWASSSKGMNRYVAMDATVGVLQFDMCGTPLLFNESIPERALSFRSITLPERRVPPRGFEWDVACARWSDLEEAWLPNGVEVQRPVYWDDVEVACVVYEADGRGTSFTAFFVPVEVTTTTTTLEWTYPTYTTFEIPPLPPVFIVSCNESLIPEPPLGYTWNCTKPGEGQECRAFCRGFPDQMTSVTCLKGQSSLEWFVTNECPVFTTTTLDMTVDKPADNAILNAMLVFVLIVIFFCSAGIFALMAYALYKFTMNEPSKSRISSKISPDAMHEVPEDEGPEDVGFDPAFMDWAKHWAENPKVQSAVLERTKASMSQDLVPTIVDQTPNPTIEAAPVTADSAFTKTVLVEYHDYWKSELEGILFSNQIPVDAEGRLYWVVNSVREILQVKDLNSLHQVNFPLTLRMQESPPQVEKAEGFYVWQVEWGALKGPSLGARKGDGKDSFDAPDEEKIDGIVPELTERQQEHEDLMQKWREQKRSLRQAAVAGDSSRQPKMPGGYPSILQSDPVQKVVSAGHVRVAGDYAGSLAQTAAQASIYVPELQDQLYQEQIMNQTFSDDDGWLEVQSPSGRIYYWNQFTFEEWDPPAEDLEPE